MSEEFSELCESYEEAVFNSHLFPLSANPIHRLYQQAPENFENGVASLLGEVYFEEWGERRLGMLYKGLILGIIKDNGDPSKRYVAWPSYMRIPTPTHPKGSASGCSQVMHTNEREQALILAMDRLQGLIEKSLEYKYAR